MTRRSHWIPRICLFALLIASFGATALAGGQPQTHDGFFLRMALGFGGANTSGDDGADELEFSGPGAVIDIAIGAMVSENLALHGSIFGWALSDPDAKLNNGPTVEANGDITVSALGAGVTYYVMPSNLYFSGEIGIATMEIDAGGPFSYDTDAGFLMQATFGKEWWVGDNWGLGLSGVAGFHTISDDVDGGTIDWSGAHFGLQFSATFN